MPEKKTLLILLSLIIASVICSCAPAPDVPLASRAESIPADTVKITPSINILPPVLHSDEYKEPVPLGSGANSAGAEDSAFIMPNGNTIYFFFTPDSRVPAEKQIIDSSTGIYVSYKQGGEWTDTERVLLRDEKDLALDGCVYVRDDEMWFCSARKGNLRELDMWVARFKDGKWQDWENAGQKLNVDYGIGEFHISSDGNEIWFTRSYQGSPTIFKAAWSSVGEWSQPELIISQFAAEPTLDNEGNIYFTNHFYKDNNPLESDIYVAYRKNKLTLKGQVNE